MGFPKTILYLDHAPIWGGAEAVLLNLIESLDPAVLRAVVGTPEDAVWIPVLARREILHRPVAFGRMNGAGVRLPLRLAQAIRSVVRVARAEQARLIHSNTVRTHIVAALAGAIAGIPVVWTIHDNTFPVWLFRLLASRVARMIAVSEWLAARYATAETQVRMVVIPNGLASTPAPAAPGEWDVRAGLDISPKAPVLLCVGRLIESKGVHVLIEAMQAVLAQVPQAQVVIVGGPNPDDAESAGYAARLQAQVATLRLEKHVHLVGQRDDVEAFYRAADLFVYPALQPEGLPTVILEAMAHGLPVIAGEIGGAGELVEDGGTGRLVKAGDAAALAQAIIDALRNDECRAGWGAAGRRRQQTRYTLAAQVEATQQVYAAVLGFDLELGNGAAQANHAIDEA